MTEGLLVETFEGMWGALDASADVSRLMLKGRRVKHLGQAPLQADDIQPAWCPILSLAPSGDVALPYDHHDGAPSLSFQVEIYADSRDARVILRLLAAVFSALRDEALAGARFGVETLDHLSFSQGNVGWYPAKNGAVPLCSATFNVTAHFRVGTEIS